MKLSDFKFLAVTAVLFFTSCSPSSFFGSNRDKGVANQTGYRQVNPNCQKLNLSESVLSVGEYRQLLSCLNSNSALDPLDRLTKKLSDEQLAPVVNALNQYMLSNPVTLNELESTYGFLDKTGLLDPTLSQVSRVLQNDEFLTSTFAVLRPAFQLDQKNKLLLKALEKISIELTPEEFNNLLETGLNLARSESFKSLVSRFSGESNSGRDLHVIAGQLIALLNDSADPRHFQVVKALRERVLDGQFFSLQDELLGSNEREIASKILPFSQVLKELGRSGPKLGSRSGSSPGPKADAVIFDGLSSLFHYMHGEVKCMKGTESIPDLAQAAVSEILLKSDPQKISDYLRRGAPLEIIGTNSLCDFPRELQTYYGAISDLANTQAIEPMTNLLKLLNDRGMVPGFLSLMSDVGSGKVKTSPENAAGLKRLIPLVAELTDRHAWDDLLLVALLPKDHAQVAHAIHFWTDQDPNLNNLSLVDILSGALAKSDPNDLYRQIHSLGTFINQSEPVLDPVLSKLRSALFVNNVHPIIDIAHDFLKSATQNQALFATLFQISDLPEFHETLQMFSQMASDGRLKELLTASITIFHRYAQQGKRGEILAASEPSLTDLTLHKLSSTNRKLVPLKLNQAAGSVSGTVAESSAETIYKACRELRFDILMSDYRTVNYEDQLKNYVTCMNFKDVTQAIDFLNSKDSKTSDGRTYLQLEIDILAQLNLGQRETGDLAQMVLDSLKPDPNSGTGQSGSKADIKSGSKFEKYANAFTLLINKPKRDASASEPHLKLLRPLLEVFGTVIRESRLALRALLNYSSELLLDRDLPKVLTYVRSLLPEQAQLDPVQSIPAEDPAMIDSLMASIASRECVADERAQRSRARKLWRDYHTAITSWDKVGFNERRTRWTRADFKEVLDPAHAENPAQRGIPDSVFYKFSDPAQNNPDKDALQALINTFQYFTLPLLEGYPAGPTRADATQSRHYSPEYLYQWISERARDPKPILYFYPGKDYPEVRLVNQLEQFELVVENSDFDVDPLKKLVEHLPKPLRDMAQPLRTLLDTGNFSQKFFGMIGEAFGDEPFEVWPEDIQRRYPKSSKRRPPTLKEVAEQIEGSQKFNELLLGRLPINHCEQLKNARRDTITLVGPSSDDPVHKLLDHLMTSIQPELLRRMFNMGQVLGVVRENLPSSDGKNKYQGGMKVLRDLFHELHTSSPEAYLSEKAGIFNNLRIVNKLARSGLMRSLGKNMSQLPGYPSNLATLSSTDRATYLSMIGLFQTFCHLSDDPTMREIFKTLFSPGDTKHDVLWGIIDGIMNLTDEQIVGFKQLLYYGVSQGDGLGITRPVNTMIFDLAKSHREYFLQHSNQIFELASSKQAAIFLRELFLNQDQESKERLSKLLRSTLNQPGLGANGVEVAVTLSSDLAAKDNWNLFLANKQALEAQYPEPFKVLVSMKDDFLDYLESSPEADKPQTSLQLRAFFSRLVKTKPSGAASEVEELFDLAAKDPDKFYQVLETLSNHIENGDLLELGQTIRRKLVH